MTPSTPLPEQGEAMNTLLSDEELRERMLQVLVTQGQDQVGIAMGRHSVDGSLYKNRTSEHLERIIDLINTQKRLYAEMVIGDDMVQVVKTYSSPIWTSGKYCDTCGFDIKENTQACGCTEVNKHIAEQKARIK